MTHPSTDSFVTMGCDRSAALPSIAVLRAEPLARPTR
jgi:hypothetical protein